MGSIFPHELSKIMTSVIDSIEIKKKFLSCIRDDMNKQWATGVKLGKLVLCILLQKLVFILKHYIYNVYTLFYLQCSLCVMYVCVYMLIHIDNHFLESSLIIKLRSSELIASTYSFWAISLPASFLLQL